MFVYVLRYKGPNQNHFFFFVKGKKNTQTIKIADVYRPITITTTVGRYVVPEIIVMILLSFYATEMMII